MGARAKILAAVGTVAVFTVLGVSSTLSGAGSATAQAPERRTAPATRTAAAAPVLAPPAGPQLEGVTVILYGDSLAWEAKDFFRDRLVAAGVGDVRMKTYGGTAICDWFDEMQRDAAEVRPDVVVLEFSGNALTTCMKTLDGRSLRDDRTAWHDKYVADAQKVVGIFGPAGTRVYFTGAPRSFSAELVNDPDINWFNSMYQSLATYTPRGGYVDAGAAVLREGRWTDRLPCLPGEPCSGAEGNVVRAPDGGHFCPDGPDAVRGVTQACSVWSSGAYRYGTAMADGVLSGLQGPAVG